MRSKVIFGLVVFLLVGSIFFYSNKVNALEKCYLKNNNDICMTEAHYNNLINLGFTEFEIQNMTRNVFDENKDLIGHVVSETVSYYKDVYYYKNGKVTSTSQLISEQEYQKLGLIQNTTKVNPKKSRSYYDGYIETIGKKMRTKIIAMIDNYRYKNTVEWKNMPVTRSYDIIGIGLENESVYCSGNRHFSQTYCTSAANCTTSSTADILNMETGVGATFKLPSGTYTSMSAMLYYDVDKRVPTVTEMNAYGDYSHATSSVTQYQAESGYTISSAGIILNYTISSYYDAIPSAEAHWDGIW